MSQSTIIFISGLVILALLFWYFATEAEKRKRNLGSLLILAIAALCAWSLVPQPPLDEEGHPMGPPESRLKPGIDLAGGSAFTVRVQPKIDDQGNTIPVSPEAIAQAIKTLRERLNPKGTKDLLIFPQPPERIIIQMPGITPEEAERTKAVITKTATLELRAVHPDSSSELAEKVRNGEAVVPGYKLYKLPEKNDKGEPLKDAEGNPVYEELFLSKRVEVKGKHVKRAVPSAARAGVIEVTLSAEGGNRMINLTKDMQKGKDRLAIVLDGEVMSAPVVQSTLASNFIIEGIDSDQERRELCAALMNPLENPVEIEEERTVSALLGNATIRQGINAGIAGLALTLVFILIYYRIAGFIALMGLSISILILFGAMAMFEFTFTLPGIAGIILTIGVAVDANVLIYERLREELKLGKSVRTAIQAAYDKAFSAIFDANITTLITAIILFWRASGTIKGFAITLTIGILASMFAALVATRVLFWWGTYSGILRKVAFFNIVPERAVSFMRKRKPAFLISSVLIIGSLLVVGIKRERALGIDFVGGAIITYDVEGEPLSSRDVQNAISDLSLAKLTTVQEEKPPGSDEILTIQCAPEDADAIVAELARDFPSLEKDPSREMVGAKLGEEFLRNALLALGMGLIGIMLYITVRFEFSFAVGAFVALIHDIIIAIGLVILKGDEISLIHVGAFLTIAGYSINDTIVVFDRIRETLRMKRGEVEDVMDLAINATLSRTLLTSLTTFAAVLVLFIFGGPALQAFSFAIMAGVIVGTYSSIFVAAPVVFLWSRARGSNLRRELLDANLEAQVNPARG